MNKTREIGDIVFTIGLTKNDNGEWLYEITAREIFKISQLPDGKVCYSGFHNELLYEPYLYDTFEEAKEKAKTLGSTLVKNFDNVLLRDETKCGNIESSEKPMVSTEEYLTGGIFDFM